MPLGVVYFGHHQYLLIMLHHFCVMVILSYCIQLRKVYGLKRLKFSAT